MGKWEKEMGQPKSPPPAYSEPDPDPKAKPPGAHQGPKKWGICFHTTFAGRGEVHHRWYASEKARDAAYDHAMNQAKHHAWTTFGYAESVVKVEK